LYQSRVISVLVWNFWRKKIGWKKNIVIFVQEDSRKWTEFSNIIGIEAIFCHILKSISRMCGRAVCGECSAKKINDNRVCDVCYYKADNKRAEERREDQLTSKHASIKTYKKQLLKEKDYLNELIQKRYNLNKVVI